MPGEGIKSVGCYRFILALVLTFSCTCAMAQYSSTIVSGRPGQALAASTAGRGILQFEQGIDLAGTKDASMRNTEYRSSHFIRFGLCEYLEVNGLLELKKQKGEEGSADPGLSSPYLGLSATLVRGGGASPSLALHAGTYLTAGSEAYRVEQPAPQFLLMAQSPLGPSFTFLTNLGLYWDGATAGPGMKYVLNLAASLPANLGAFVENYGTYYQDEYSTWFDGGFSYLLNPDLQLDLAGGFGKNGTARDLFVSLGISWRLDLVKENRH